MLNCKKIVSFCMLLIIIQSSILSAEDSLPLKPTRKVSFVTDEGSSMSVDVSPDGKTILFGLLGDLYTLDIKGGEAKRITSGMEYDTNPVYSPDGTKIAFTTDRSGSQNLWVANADGSNPRNISQSNRAALMYSPAWSPDGLYVYVTRGENAKDQFRIWIHHIMGGVVSR